MKKIIALGFFVFLAIWLGSTAYIGHAFKSGQSDYAASINRTLVENDIPAVFTIESVEYGFFGSNSEIQLSIKASSGEEEEPQIIQIKQTSYNGPLMMTEHGLKFGANYQILRPDLAGLMDDEQGAALQSAFGEQVAIQFGLLMGFSDNHKAYAQVSPFRYADEESGVLISLDQGIVISANTDKKISWLTGQADFGAVSIEDAASGARASIGQSELLMDITELYAGSMLAGTAEYRLGKVDFLRGDESVSLENFLITARSDNTDGKLSGQSSMSIDKIATTLPASRPMLEGPFNLQLDVNYSGLDEVAVKQMADQNKKVNQQLYLSLLSGDVDALVSDEMAEGQAKNIRLMAGLVKQGLMFDYKIMFANEVAKAELAVDFSWVDSQSLVQKQSLGELLKAVQSQLVVTVEKALIENTPLEGMVQMPVSMGYAIESGDRFLATVDFNKGVLLLNDKRVPYLDKMGSAVDKPLPWP
jgi:hypothetical protein